MRRLVSRLQEWIPAAVLAAALGAALRAQVSWVSASPRTLVEATLGAGVGLAVGLALRLDARRGARAAAAALGIALGAALTLWLPWPPAAFATACVMAGLAAALPRPGGGAGALLIAAPASLAAFLWPIPSALVAAAAAGVARAPKAAEPEPPSPAPILEALPRALLLAGAAALITGAWAAGRARLDPTPSAFALTLAAALAAAALGRAGGPRSLGGGAALLSAAALICWAGVGALPHRSAQWVYPLAGEQDPRLLLAAMTCALALPGGFVTGALSQGARGAGLAIALGAWVGADTGPALPSRLVVLAAAAALIGLVLQGHWGRRGFAALALAAAAALGLSERPWPEEQLARGLAMSLRAPDAPDDARRALDGLQATAGGWGPDGAALTYTKGRDLELSYLDGAALPTEGRAPDAERLLGHLAVAMAARSEHAMVLGDSRGLVTQALITQRLADVLVHVPNPSALRAQAAASPQLRETMLHPSIRLQHGPSELTLRSAEPLDVLVEVARTPWLDGYQGLPDRARLRARRDSLREGGAYLLMLPIVWMDAPSLRAALADFVEVFPMAWGLLPPNGADQLTLVGWAGPAAARWERFVQASTLGFDALAPLGIRSPFDLADRALVGPAGLRALGAEGQRRSSVSLWPTLHRRPAMLLSLALPEVDSPSDLFVSHPDPDRDAKLAARADINRGLLQLLSEAARGDFKEIVSQSRALLDDPAGVRALDPIIQPYLDRANALVAQGIEEGPGSEAWSRCLRETESARLLNPLAADIYAVSAKCKLARQDVRGAENDLRKALELEPGHLEALLGLNQLHYARGELAQAEQRLREAVKYNPRSWRPLYYLGVLLMELGRLDEADALLLQAKGFAGDTTGLPVGALAHVQLLKGDPNTALTYAELAVNLDRSATHLHLRGWAYLEVDQLEQAERDLKAAVYADPDNFLARGDLGRVYARRGEYEAAIEAWKQVLAADPGNVQAQENLRRAQPRVAPE